VGTLKQVNLYPVYMAFKARAAKREILCPVLMTYK
jgi:hypothetical protein